MIKYWIKIFTILLISVEYWYNLLVILRM